MRKLVSLSAFALIALAPQMLVADQLELSGHSNPFPATAAAVPFHLAEHDPYPELARLDANPTQISNSVEFGFLEDQPNYFVVNEAKAPLFAGLFIGAAFVFHLRRGRPLTIASY